MSNYKTILDSVHRSLGRSSFITKIAILLRNQCRRIIACHLSEGPDPAINGEDWLISLLAPNALTFVDVGANKGDWTNSFLEASSGKAKGILFEPGTAAIEFINQRFDRVNNLEIIDIAVADYVGQTSFFEQPNIGVGSSILSQWVNNFATEKKCKVSTLDIELEKYNWDFCDVLKIDCEGYDFKVIQGASKLIQNHKIGIIQFEYNAPWAFANSTLIAAIDFLNSCKYEVFLLKSSGLYNFNYDNYGEFMEYSNFVAVSPMSKETVLPYIRSEL
jgi:FkbM family methyltransferase